MMLLIIDELPWQCCDTPLHKVYLHVHTKSSFADVDATTGAFAKLIKS